MLGAVKTYFLDFPYYFSIILYGVIVSSLAANEAALMGSDGAFVV